MKYNARIPRLTSILGLLTNVNLNIVTFNTFYIVLYPIACILNLSYEKFDHFTGKYSVAIKPKASAYQEAC